MDRPKGPFQRTVAAAGGRESDPLQKAEAALTKLADELSESMRASVPAHKDERRAEEEYVIWGQIQDKDRDEVREYLLHHNAIEGAATPEQHMYALRWQEIRGL